ncbi:tyrosinase family protein [Streptomyces inhibens]|uniref:tyrosinase family protein n=1 Tax=Streptomyces inhibens TaxID=2293571 RepID=UPI001EE6F305|nr:tyrosinase family protein [Streptomyces inhibens]UKY48573.1 tyrosinase family protein [Streptomyces inhibens]
MGSHTRRTGNGPDNRTATADTSRRQFLRSSTGAALAAGALAVTATPARAGATTGPARRVLVRKDVKDLTRREKYEYVEAIHRLKRMPSPYSRNLSYYDELTSWHLQVHRCGFYGHMSPVFLPWHRALLLCFETALAHAAGGPIAVPYWDWTDPSSTAAVLADDFMGPYGAPEDDYAVLSGPFRRGAWEVTLHGPPSDDPGQFRYLVRAPGTASIAPTLPTAADMRAALLRPVYDVAPWDLSSDPEQSFRQYWEGWVGFGGHGECVDDIMQPTVGSDVSKVAIVNHNRVHFYVGGIFVPSSAVKVYGEGYLAAQFGLHGAVYGTIVPATAPNDPLFWLLHSNVDRVWNMWQQHHPHAYRPVTGGPRPQNLDDRFDVLAPYTRFKTIRSVQDIRALGYRYT